MTTRTPNAQSANARARQRYASSGVGSRTSGDNVARMMAAIYVSFERIKGPYSGSMPTEPPVGLTIQPTHMSNNCVMLASGRNSVMYTSKRLKLSNIQRGDIPIF